MGQMIYEKVETYTPDLSEENEKIYDEFSMKKKYKATTKKKTTTTTKINKRAQNVADLEKTLEILNCMYGRYIQNVRKPEKPVI